VASRSSPDAVPDDGQFDIAVLKTRTLGDWVGVAPRILIRSHKAGPDVDTFRAAKVEIGCDRAQPVQFDSDTVDPTDRFDLEIDPSSLTLAVPEHHQDQTPQSGKTPAEHQPASRNDRRTRHCHLRSTRPPLGDIILGRPSGGGRAGACAVADVVALAGGAFFSQIERQGRRLDIVRRTLAAARGWCGWVGMVGSVGVLDGGGGPPGQVLGQGEVGLGCSGRAGGWPR
jgi:hypothetical protein